jgi:demethylmenaquinone methyltransferase/2-methoxy-6-polyprenyl-1,4-benzoquinol methylase
MGTSAARWGMELEPIDDRQIEATMWVEVDLKTLMRAIPGRVLNDRIRRVMEREMAAIKAALESATPGGSDSYRGGGRRGASALTRTRSEERGGARDATEIEDTVSQMDSTRQHLIETYRKKAKHYDITSRFYPVPGYPQQAQRLRAVQELGLRPGDSVVDIACGTGLNFSLIEEVVGPHGRIVGVDLTDAMLAQAQHRIEANGWSNISLVQADAAEFNFPTEVNAILSTYALSQVPECGDVIAHGAAALSPGGRWVVLDLEVPDDAPRWLAQLGIELVRPFARIDEWIVRRPWEAIRAALQDELVDLSWSELFFGTAFLAVGSRGYRTVDESHRERWLPDDEGAPSVHGRSDFTGVRS